MRDFIPNLPPSAIPLFRERDRTRALDPQHLSLADPNHEISTAIANNSRQTWIDKIQSINLQLNTSKFWSLLKSLSGRPSQLLNQPITFGPRTRTLSSSMLTAQSFCHQFTLIPNYRRLPSSLCLAKQLRKSHPLSDFPLFTSTQVFHAIKTSGTSTALGPDNLNIFRYLTHTYNLSLSSASIPAIWMSATVNANFQTRQTPLPQLLLPPYLPSLPSGEGARVPTATSPHRLPSSRRFPTWFPPPPFHLNCPPPTGPAHCNRLQPAQTPDPHLHYGH